MELKSYEDVRCGLEELDVVDEIAAIIRRCLSEDPGKRPSNTIVLLEEIDRLQDKRTEAWAEIPTYYLQLTKKALASLRLAFPGESDANLQQFVLDDLTDVVGLALHHATDHATGQQPGEGAVHFYAYGANKYWAPGQLLKLRMNELV